MAHTTDIAESNGQRLARLRKRHRWTQARLATESGYSLSAIRHFEQGHRSLDRAAVVLAFAQALDCHPTEITGAPYVPVQTDRDGQAAVASVAAVRRAILRHGRPARPTESEAATIDLPRLHTRVDDANQHRQAAALTKSGAELPALLRDLQVAAELTDGDQRRDVFNLLGKPIDKKLTTVPLAVAQQIARKVEALGIPCRVFAGL